MTKVAMKDAVKNYFKSTTLHGFKYLNSRHSIDRFGWLLGCVASACCAGMLLSVLWARFTEVSTVLTLYDNVQHDNTIHRKIPVITVCPTIESVADTFLKKLSANEIEKQKIPIILTRVLTGLSVPEDNLLLFNNFLLNNNVSFQEIMVKYAPRCRTNIKKCRYQNIDVPCEQLFKSELIAVGVCCTLYPNKLEALSQRFEATSLITQMLDLILEYRRGSKYYGCQLVTMYENEEDTNPKMLLPGTYNMAYHRFGVVSKNPAPEGLLVESTCDPRKKYSRALCLLECAEYSCGCQEPLRPAKTFSRTSNLPVCSIAQMECVRGGEHKNNRTCNCLPSCTRVTTSMVIIPSKLTVRYTIDPFFKGLNVSSSIVVQIRVNVGYSRIFLPIPTDNWVTLLSSFGGVFNMFLGVGLFNILELLFLIFIKLPASFRKSSEIHPSSTHQEHHDTHVDNRLNEITALSHINMYRREHPILFDPFKSESVLRH